jgi:hypothetical protein
MAPAPYAARPDTALRYVGTWLFLHGGSSARLNVGAPERQHHCASARLSVSVPERQHD